MKKSALTTLAIVLVSAGILFLANTQGVLYRGFIGADAECSVEGEDGKFLLCPATAFEHSTGITLNLTEFEEEEMRLDISGTFSAKLDINVDDTKEIVTDNGTKVGITYISSEINGAVVEIDTIQLPKQKILR